MWFWMPCLVCLVFRKRECYMCASKKSGRGRMGEDFGHVLEKVGRKPLQ